MKRVLIVCHNYDAAKIRFHDMIQQHETTVSRASHAQLTVDIGNIEYEFISQHSSDRIIGRTYHSIVIDEMVKMTTEQTILIMSRKRS